MEKQKTTNEKMQEIIKSPKLKKLRKLELQLKTEKNSEKRFVLETDFYYELLCK